MKRIAGIGLLALAAVVATALLVRPGSVGSQPLLFNHRLHIEELGAECTDCHLYAASGVRATIPNLEVCAGCHDEALTESPEEARLLERIRQGEPIPWRKVYWVPDHVYFSHRRHTAIAGLECQRCHGAVEQMAVPIIRRAVRLDMESCMSCHRDTGVSNDCLLCHV